MQITQVSGVGQFDNSGAGSLWEIKTLDCFLE